MSDLLNQYLERLPSHFYKDKDSNNYKLFQILAEQGESKQTILRIMQQYEDIDQAEGQKLDFHGQDVGCERGNMDDVEYRKRIKIQIIINLSEADIEAINTILTAYMGEDFLRLEEGWSSDFEEPASLLFHFSQSTKEIPYQLLRQIKPAGVMIITLINQMLEHLKLSGLSYTFPVKYRITNKFRTAPMPGMKADVPLVVQGNTYDFKVKYPVCGKFSAGGD
ncbi:hypothetical protein [Bacillus sp. JJ722]|uniref:hypothetical protein n=1 Tax=Bacillus sp. JJ722 TaxID=3122973 RepID=UPI002FFEDE0B